MTYYTLLSIVPKSFYCLKCQLDGLPSDIRETTRDHYQELLMHPECHNYYYPFIQSAIASCDADDLETYRLYPSDYLTEFMEEMDSTKCQPSDILARVLATPEHQEMGSAGSAGSPTEISVWHSHQIEIVETWGFDSKAWIQHLWNTWGDARFWQEWERLTSMAIRCRAWKWYRQLLDMQPANQTRSVVGNRYYYNLDSQDMERFLSIAPLADKIDLLKYACSPLLMSRIIRDMNWQLVSRADINIIASRLVSNRTLHELQNLREAGLEFDDGCVCCDPNAYYQMWLSEFKRQPESAPATESLVSIRFEHVDYFRALGFGEGCFHVCYIEACMQSDLEAIQTLQPDMPIEVVILAFRLKLLDTNILRQCGSVTFIYDVESHEKPRKGVPEAKVTEIIMDYLLPRVEASRLASDLQDIVAETLDRHLTTWQRLVSDVHWPTHVRNMVTDYASQLETIKMFKTTDKQSQQVDATFLVKYLTNNYHLSSHEILQLTRENNIALNTVIAHENYGLALIPPETTTWGLYLLFQKAIAVADLMALALQQNQMSDMVDAINTILTPGGVESVCARHDVCYYSRIMTSQLVLICRDLVQNHVLTPNTQSRLQPWL